jgi:hypothetical protein
VLNANGHLLADVRGDSTRTVAPTLAALPTHALALVADARRHRAALRTLATVTAGATARYGSASGSLVAECVRSIACEALGDEAPPEPSDEAPVAPVAPHAPMPMRPCTPEEEAVIDALGPARSTHAVSGALDPTEVRDLLAEGRANARVIEARIEALRTRDAYDVPPWWGDDG